MAHGSNPNTQEVAAGTQMFLATIGHTESMKLSVVNTIKQNHLLIWLFKCIKSLQAVELKMLRFLLPLFKTRSHYVALAGQVITEILLPLHEIKGVPHHTWQKCQSLYKQFVIKVLISGTKMNPCIGLICEIISLSFNGIYNTTLHHSVLFISFSSWTLNYHNIPAK